MCKVGFELVRVSDLSPIEAFSTKRASNIEKKICELGFWTKPIIVEKTHMLVLDGHHRFSICKKIGLKKVPAVLVDYCNINVRSLRKNHVFSREDVISNAKSGNIYPYKTVKHDFDFELPSINIPLEQLK